MPTLRRVGQEVDGNARRGPNTSPTGRQRIIAKREAGVTVRERAAEFGRSESTIKYTIHTYTKPPQQRSALALGGLVYYRVTRKKSYTGSLALRRRLSTQSSRNRPYL
jgi:hypothetical protein